jgi:hypothetical protein
MRAHPGIFVVAATALAAFAALGSSGCHIGLAGVILGASEAKPPYAPGAIAADLGSGAVRTLACLDIGLAISTPRPLLEMDVGNRCVRAERFDLGRMAIRASDADGADRTVRLVDPRQEIGRMHVGAMERGHERIPLSGLDDVTRVCFDVTAVATDAPDARPPPICLDRQADGWHAS